ncbi:hypothetical protein DSOL_4157 [Desulfosporosinus metallidurans]|uniref:Uncharacterized protein n=1 Tax=Desulfosporosinus metallidurans TaxID=1888891 RepID=A0A1Q8QLP2_9FIRM|nr:hypothetical protein DSOL_4157 [Desulfosporosinus metallidurans]
MAKDGITYANSNPNPNPNDILKDPYVFVMNDLEDKSV